MNKLGFGFLHLPMKEDKSVDMDALNEMVDAFLAGGGTYFDTAYTYLNGQSEWALRESLVKRHQRDSFRIATKLPGYLIKSHCECYRYFEEELERCGVEYFDVYMLHWLNEKHYRIAEQTNQFGFLQELKASGKAKKIGFSYHDTADLLEEILTAHPEVDYVLMQLNYADWESESIQSRRCYETAVRHGKKVIVMEPIKGGTLVNPPEEARKLLKSVRPDATPSALALSFAERLPEVEIVLSGMSDLNQVRENLQERAPLTDAQWQTMLLAAEQINRSTAVKCSGCGYCLASCPKHICIPNYFRLYNDITREPDDSWKIKPAYQGLAQSHGKASECVGCKQCENHCPQKLPITDILKKLVDVFEK